RPALGWSPSGRSLAVMDADHPTAMTGPCGNPWFPVSYTRRHHSSLVYALLSHHGAPLRTVRHDCACNNRPPGHLWPRLPGSVPCSMQVDGGIIGVESPGG